MSLGRLEQTAVYWAPNSWDADGQPTLGSPVEIDCRWEEAREEFITPAGDREMSKAVVYVASDVEEKGVLYLGTTSDSAFDSADAKANTNAWEIRGFEKTPNLPGTDYLRTAFL